MEDLQKQFGKLQLIKNVKETAKWIDSKVTGRDKRIFKPYVVAFD